MWTDEAYTTSASMLQRILEQAKDEGYQEGLSDWRGEGRMSVLNECMNIMLHSNDAVIDIQALIDLTKEVSI